MNRPWPFLFILGWCLLSAAADAAEPEAPPAAPPSEAPAPPTDDHGDAAARSTATRQAITTRKLSIDVTHVPLQELLEMLTSQAGVGLALDGKITAEMLRMPLSLKLRDASVYAVLHWIFRKHELAWAVDGGEILVATADGIRPDVAARQEEFVRKTEKRWRDAATPGLTGTRLSLNVVGVPLVRLLNLVAERAELNVVWEEKALGQRGRRITLDVSEMPVREILDKLAAQAALTWSLEAEAIFISPEKP